MSVELLQGLLAGGAVGAVAAVIGSVLVYRAKSKEIRSSAAAEAAKTEVNAAAATDTAQDKLIDQLQEELKRYRDDNDRRVEKLELQVGELQSENRGYRAFIGIQRDHMAQHGVPLPPWPEGLPR